MKKYLVPVLLGILGVLIGLSAWHLYIDHHNLHAVVQLAAKIQQQQPMTSEKGLQP